MTLIILNWADYSRINVCRDDDGTPKMFNDHDKAKAWAYDNVHQHWQIVRLKR